MGTRRIIKTHGPSELIYTESQFIDFLLAHSKNINGVLWLSTIELDENDKLPSKNKLITRFSVSEVEC